MKVIKFAPGLIPVLKHQEHDQSSHGNWAGDGVSFKQDRNSLTMQDKSGQTLASVDFVNLGNNRLDVNSIDSFDGGKGYATKVLEKLYSLFPEHSIFWGKTIVPESTHLAQKFSDKYGRTQFMPWGEGVIAGYEWGKLYGDTTVKKHQEHDQSTHGNWADGSSESGLDAMPYEWKPEFKERERLTARELSSEELNLGRSQLQQVAEAPIAIRVSSGDLELRKIVEHGGFKSLTELPEPTLGFEIEYNEGRYDLEKGLWGQPTNANSPIYGYFDTPLQPSVGNETLSYGDVKIILKDKVAGRTTISPGDSANHGLTPVLVTDARKGNLSLEQVDSAYRSRHFQRNMTTVSRPIRSVRTIRDIDYFEAQIHGGVRLSDIKSVRLQRFSIVGEDTIALLEKAGIEVTRDDK